MPVKNKATGEIDFIGLAKAFTKSEELELCLAEWISRAPIITMANSRVFITDDDVEFNDMDAYVVSQGELVYRQNFHMKKIEEVNIGEWATQYSEKVIRANKRLQDTKLKEKNRNLKDELEEAIKYIQDNEE